ncbi:SDR family NAD(P)-dependent oxidoreductase [Rhodococcus opacus]|uniref:SDR family NAD(P)-dependent oxidoreductase n=1 Tax=Rhodococcus opacus TaxID=37919 RepID=UPI001C461AF9|nr:SDR family NAD(P)-dependent oxidoreductase [Rhodococcus opacus]MBV6754840.1 SDR family oxidoreductase [Rhodococcus opacus]
MTNAEQPLPNPSSHRLRVLVTGVEQAEGAHTARILAERGCRVITHSFSADAADAVVAEITDTGATAYPAVADLTIETDVDRLFTGIEDRHGGLDVLIHTAWLPGPETAAHDLAGIAPADWGRFTYDHMAALFLTTRRAAASMQHNPIPASILTVSGLGTVGTSALARDAINGAIESFTLAAARDTTLAGLRINTIRLTAEIDADVADAVPPRLDDVLDLLLGDRTLGSGHVIPAQPSYALVPS